MLEKKTLKKILNLDSILEQVIKSFVIASKNEHVLAVLLFEAAFHVEY